MKDVEEGESENADTHTDRQINDDEQGRKGEKGGKGEVMCYSSDSGVGVCECLQMPLHSFTPESARFLSCGFLECVLIFLSHKSFVTFS